MQGTTRTVSNIHRFTHSQGIEVVGEAIHGVVVAVRHRAVASAIATIE